MPNYLMTKWSEYRKAGDQPICIIILSLLNYHTCQYARTSRTANWRCEGKFFRSDSMQRSLKSMVIFNVPLQLLWRLQLLLTSKVQTRVISLSLHLVLVIDWDQNDIGMKHIMYNNKWWWIYGSRNYMSKIIGKWVLSILTTLQKTKLPT